MGNDTAAPTTVATGASVPTAPAANPASQPPTGPAVQPVLPDGDVPARQRGRKTPAFGVKFNRDPKRLVFFQVQIWTYMQEYCLEIAIKLAKV